MGNIYIMYIKNIWHIFSFVEIWHINHKAYKVYYHQITSLQDPKSRDVIKSDKDSSAHLKDWLDIDGLSPVYTAQEVGPFEIFVVNGTGGQMGTLPYKRDRVSKRDENIRLWLWLCCIWTPLYILSVLSYHVSYVYLVAYDRIHIPVRICVATYIYMYIYIYIGLGVIRKCETC